MDGEGNDPANSTSFYPRESVVAFPSNEAGHSSFVSSGGLGVARDRRLPVSEFSAELPPPPPPFIPAAQWGYPEVTQPKQSHLMRKEVIG